MKRLAVAWCAALLLSLCHLVPTASAAPREEAAATSVPVLAYYYQWFTPKSWDRAKIDYPLAGRYSSDDVSIMQRHIAEAKSAGIGGFIVSWKSTPTNNRRLEALIKVARAADFKLAVIYQGLDFYRKPQSVQRIAADFDFFKQHYGPDPVFHIFAKPLLIWSGTWEFSAPDIERVTKSVRDSALVLATEKSPSGYRRVAQYFDGNAYYWSSVDPGSNSRYQERLNEMAATIHKSGGLWIAPFAPGFDARLVGGTREVPRRDGQTLRIEYNAAVASSPDALGLISWNEFSENTHIEPSERYGNSALQELTSLVQGPSVQEPPVIADSDDPGRDGILTVGAALLLLLLLAAALPIYAYLRRARGPSAEHPEQSRRSLWRTLVAVAVVAVLGSLTAVGVVYARRPRDAGATPLYIGAQPARDPGSVVIAAAGDIACPPGRRHSEKEFDRPNACGMDGTAKVLGMIQPDAVLTLGDHQYPSGSLADFQASYADTWGAYRDITFPVPGNHEYGTPGARGYFAYFGKRAGDPDKGYYSYDLGSWHVIALNSECDDEIGGCRESDPQATWLRQDLEAHPRTCVLAYWHRPRFSSGTHGNDPDQDAIWRILAEAGTDVVLAGHDHDYERFAPMNADGKAHPEGITQFVVGTGGASHYKFHNPEPTSQFRSTGRNGVLRLQLTEQAYAWEFTVAPKGEVIDSGNSQCS